jgi:hypothetical protein
VGELPHEHHIIPCTGVKPTLVDDQGMDIAAVTGKLCDLLPRDRVEHTHEAICISRVDVTVICCEREHRRTRPGPHDGSAVVTPHTDAPFV